MQLPIYKFDHPFLIWKTWIVDQLNEKKKGSILKWYKDENNAYKKHLGYTPNEWQCHSLSCSSQLIMTIKFMSGKSIWVFDDQIHSSFLGTEFSSSNFSLRAICSSGKQFWEIKNLTKMHFLFLYRVVRFFTYVLAQSLYYWWDWVWSISNFNN